MEKSQKENIFDKYYNKEDLKINLLEMKRDHFQNSSKDIVCSRKNKKSSQ